MIQSFTENRLERFYNTGETGRLPPEDVKKIRRILDRLNVAIEPKDMQIPGIQVSRLPPQRGGGWRARVSRNLWIAFRFNGFDVYDVHTVTE